MLKAWMKEQLSREAWICFKVIHPVGKKYLNSLSIMATKLFGYVLRRGVVYVAERRMRAAVVHNNRET